MKALIEERSMDISLVRYELNQGMTIMTIGIVDPLMVTPLGDQAVALKIETPDLVLYQTDHALFRKCEVIPKPMYEFTIPNIE